MTLELLLLVLLGFAYIYVGFKLYLSFCTDHGILTNNFYYATLSVFWLPILTIVAFILLSVSAFLLIANIYTE